MTFRAEIESESDPVPISELPDLTGASGARAGRYRSPWSTTVRMDSAASTGQPDVVDLASLESFPASDPPGWIAVSIGSPCGNASTRALRDQTAVEADLARSEPHRRAEDAAGAGLSSSLPERPVTDDRRPLPATEQGVAVRIYRAGRSVTQSGPRFSRRWIMEFDPRWAPEIEPLMGWTSSRDTMQQVKLSFSSKEAAMAFAARQGWPCSVIDPPAPQLRPPFRSERLGLWPRPPLRKTLQGERLSREVRS